jgi:hippurate hydrolase
MLLGLPSMGAEPRWEPLWPDGAPGALGKEEADQPALAAYLAPEDKRTAAAVVVCPGGGYGMLAMDHEGRQIVEWLNSLGVNAFLLRYRLGPRYHHPAPLQDAQRAIRTVRLGAKKLGIAPDRIGIWGFSAGGHLASTAGTHFDAGVPGSTDPIERVSSRPDFLILAYPVISFTAEYTHDGSRKNLLGPEPDPKLLEDLSNEKQVTPQTPPTFLFHTDEDKGVPPENSLAFYLALRKAGVPAELHVYQKGPHGVGLARGDEVLSSWAGRLADWLKSRGLLAGDRPASQVEPPETRPLRAAESPAPASAALRDLLPSRVNAEYPYLDALYKGLHQHPELSSREEKTASRIAAELKEAGFEVTAQLGGHGVAGILRNGNGPTVLIRTDLDALPVLEETELPYASKAHALDDKGNDVAVMHACGHDVHMTVFTGTARLLAWLKDRWQGTLVMVGQPAEEISAGARKMLAEGLFTRFPKPDYCLALHVNAALPAGTVSWVEGFALANVDTVNVTLHGVGGHGAWPHMTKDPIVLAAQTILALQTIVSRETEPGNAAVVTVGSIHGGTKHNVIPNEVKLQLTVRSYAEQVRANTLASIRRIARGLAVAAGIPEDRQPTVTTTDDSTPALYNDPTLVRRLRGVHESWLGTERMRAAQPVMGGEDFSRYGRTSEKIPIAMFWLGSVDPESIKESERTGRPLPSLHSSLYHPLPEPTIKTGVTAMTAAALELLGRKGGGG